eukprot:CAMPEP_0178446232 /NCGR_PEP_ID=MMETSP0689_2-20121128/40682_1 /TAXON_ID=160604 /ORGANISM="Amphidinium massartii, Strain CS-259" /LENGTH=218 /DNA_ID=CAMNT_0020071019 /DNA_START=37 /DNA_END=693 /DNA_ORIENTATION=-
MPSQTEQQLLRKGPPRMLIVHASQTNHTKALGEEIMSGAVQGGLEVRLKSVAEASFVDDILHWNADAIVLGSPTHFGNVAASLLAWVEEQWAPYWGHDRIAGKVGAVFATGGGMHQGMEHVLVSLARMMWSFNLHVVMPSPTLSGYITYGAGAVTGTTPFNESTPLIAEPYAAAARAFGQYLATETAASVARKIATHSTEGANGGVGRAEPGLPPWHI